MAVATVVAAIALIRMCGSPITPPRAGLELDLGKFSSEPTGCHGSNDPTSPIGRAI